LRVIAGSLGGRRLVAPRGLATRPTSDRVREGLFSMLGDLSDARVLDLFAGTGALGIESISRGARHATFVENARPALESLRENLTTLGLGDRTRVIAKEVERAAPSLAGPFDLVFADPPYAMRATIAPLVAALAAAFAPDARFVFEHASRDTPPTLPSFEVRPPRIYGDTAISVYQLSVS
jgi:16S rRNA (guanine966-N2)-methyltransferase